MTGRLGDLATAELTTRPILAVPLGSCEQHGPHLPLDTDTRIATALAEALAGPGGDDHPPVLAGTRVLVAPPVAVSASGEHDGFPGTLSIGLEVVERLVVELCRSADWADGVVLVNGHGGNAVAVRRAAATLHAEGRNVLSWWPTIAGDAHAGHLETSLMLAIAPGTVHMERAEAGRTEPIGKLLDELRHSGVRAVSPNGVLGDPRSASAEEGRRLFDLLVADLVDAVAEWRSR